MYLRIDKFNREIAIPVPLHVPPAGMRASLHRLLDLALDEFDVREDGAEIHDEAKAPPAQAEVAA